MPQMAPMLWLIIMVTTTFTMFMLSSWIYFFNKKNESLKMKFKKNLNKIKW